MIDRRFGSQSLAKGKSVRKLPDLSKVETPQAGKVPDPSAGTTYPMLPGRIRWCRDLALLFAEAANPLGQHRQAESITFATSDPLSPKIDILISPQVRAKCANPEVQLNRPLVPRSSATESITFNLDFNDGSPVDETFPLPV